MNLKCQRCEQDFEAARFRGYCDECVDHFRGISKQVHAKQNPRPGVHACGKFTTEATPISVHDPVVNKNVCGLCGGDTEGGYGFAGGRGCGAYNFCVECYAVLDFSEDKDA